MKLFDIVKISTKSPGVEINGKTGTIVSLDQDHPFSNMVIVLLHSPTSSGDLAVKIPNNYIVPYETDNQDDNLRDYFLEMWC